MTDSKKQAVIIALFAILIGSTLLAAGRNASASPLIGMNTTWITDYGGELMFADAMKTSRQWADTTGAVIPNAQLDVNGWPQQDAEVIAWAGASNLQGTYALSFNGKATITFGFGSATVSNQVYNSGTNTTTATVTVTNPDSLEIQFYNSQRTNTSATNTGVSNVQLMRPSTIGGSTPYAFSTMFTTVFKNYIGKFNVIRFKDYMSTDGNPLVNWTDRTRPNWSSQQRWLPTSSQAVGGSIENAILLCNDTGRDMWMNVPVSATDDYVTKLAQTIAFGSDGTNPYTTTQASPVYPPLNANLKVYIEFANEIWNTAYPFYLTWNANHSAAIAEVNAGGSPLNFDGDTNDNDWGARRHAKRTVEISNILRATFGSAAMMTRIRPVLESQEGYETFWLFQQAHMMEDYYNNASKVATPHPPSYYVYGGGGAAYYSPNSGDPNLTINNIWTSGAFDVANWAGALAPDSADTLCLYGHRVAYEGGPGFNMCSCSSDALWQQAWTDSRMTTLVTNHQTTWNQYGGDLLVYFGDQFDFQWGFTDSPANLNTPKMNAVTQIDASTTSTGTYGSLLPATISAGAANAPGFLPSLSNMDASGNATWIGYAVRNTAANTYSVSLNAGSVGTANQADIYVDGALAGTITIPNTGGNTTYAATSSITTPSLAPGSHGVMVKAKAGSFGFNAITIASSGPPTIPPAPAGLTATASYQQVSLSWNLSSGATAYNVYRGTTPGGESGTAIASGIIPTNFVNTGLTNGTTYYYTVKAVNSAGTSGASNEASATPLDNTAHIASAATPPTIDGNNADAVWSTATSYNITTLDGGGTIGGASDCSASFKSAWDSTNLYMLVDVTDDVKNNDSTNTYDDDSVDIYVDGDNSKGGSYDADDVQYTFGWNDAAVTAGTNASGKLTGVTMGQANPSSTSYRIEMKIPWSSIGTTASSGKLIGLDLAINDDDDGGSRDGKLAWKDSTDSDWWNPSLFGLGLLQSSGGSVPGTPGALTATAGNAQIALSWGAASGATSYNVYRGTSAGGESGTPIATGIATTAYTNTGLTNGTTYYYKVAGVNATGTGAQGNEASATPQAAGSGAKVITSVRFFPRPSWPQRMTGGIFQGSNDNVTYTNLVTITTQPTDGVWTTLTVGNGTAWRYVRYLGANASWCNVAEIEFYNGATKLTGTGFGTAGSYLNGGNTFDKALDGNTATYFDGPDPGNGEFVGLDFGAGSVPAAPTGLSATSGNLQVALSWSAASGATSYNVYRGTSAGGESGTAIATGIATTAYTNTGLTSGTTYYFKVAGVNASGTGAQSNEASATPTGGTLITSVRFFPRANWTNRMTGGIFQGSTNNSTWVNLVTVTTQPAGGVWTTLTVSTGTHYRYLRYLSPNAGYGDVSEIEFYVGAAKQTGTGFGTAGSWNNSGTVFGNALDGNTGTYFDAPEPGNGDYVGIDLGS